LNLIAATKVIIMEPWWNSALDQQAFCRVWRMGQTERTELVRICIRGTIDQRVTDIQNNKARSIAKIVMNGDLRKYIKSLSAYPLIVTDSLVGSKQTR
jgi:SNF2 family DNA or RNA helicase